MITCSRCPGRVLLDRDACKFTYEVYCINCGKRDFIEKLSAVGRYITKNEFKLMVS